MTENFAFSEKFSAIRVLPLTYICLHEKWPLFWSDFNQFWTFSKDFRKILKCRITWKFVQWEQICFML